jgi:HlyD family secretion protein
MAGPDLSVLSRNSSATSAVHAHVPMPKSRWKTRVLLPGIVLLSFGSLLAYSARDALYPATEVHTVPAIVKLASGSGGSVTFQAAGWVEPDPYSVLVSALTDGVIKEMLVLEGQPVKAGQIVARVVDDDAKLALQRAEAEVRQKESSVKIQEATLKAAQREWENPVDRTRMVAVSEAQISENKAGLMRLESEIEAEMNRCEELSEQLKREEIAGKAFAIPEWQVLQSRLRQRTQHAMVEASQAKRGEIAAKIKQLEAECAAAKDNLRLRIQETKMLDEAKATLMEAQALYDLAVVIRKEAELRLNRTEVRSPIDGVVMQRLKEPGDKLMLNADMANASQVLKIYNPKKLQVRVDVPLADASHLSVGQEAKIVVDVLRDVTFRGQVTRVVHEADIQKNTLQVKVAINEPRPELKPEMLARVQFVAITPATSDKTDPRQRVFAPENAMQRNGTQATVWIVDKGRNVAMKRSVVLGETRMEGHIEVMQGLQPGDAIISGDVSTLLEGQKVKMMGEANGGGENHVTH